MRTDSLHKADAPLGLTWCSWLLTCAHPAWKSTSAAHFFCTSGEVTVENLKISRGQLAPCQKESDKGATNSEFCWMQSPGTEFGLSIGFDAFLLSFKTKRVLLFTISLCLCPPGHNSGISNRTGRRRSCPRRILGSFLATHWRHTAVEYRQRVAQGG